jgi:tetratricopeptide (TPR) repeat protein
LRGSSSPDRKLLLAIVLIALAVRIGYVVDIADSPYLQYPLLDSFWYDAKAKDVLAGDLWASSGTFRVPLYIYFVAGTYSLFGASLLRPIVIQIILGALSCGLIFLIGKRVFGRLAGFLGGLGYAIYGMAVFSDGEVLPNTLFVFLMLGGVYFAIEAIERVSVGRGLLSGVLLGLAFLTWPVIVPYSAALVLLAAVAFRRRRGVAIAISLAAAFTFTMLFQGVRNNEVFGDFFILSPQGAVNLYIGNAGYADGMTPVAPPTSHPYDIGTDPSQDSIILGCRQAALESVGRELTDRELSGYYMHKTWGEIRNDLPRWLGLLARKFYFFVNSYERSDIKLIPRYIERQSAVLSLPLLPYAAAISFGFVGLVLSVWRRNRLALIVVAGVAVFALNALMFFVVWRYRHPAVPFLMILAGYAVSEVYWSARRKDYKIIGAIMVGACLIALLSASRFWGIDEEKWAGQHLINEAASYLQSGDYEGAVEVYHEAIELEPSNARVYFYLGKAHATEGQVDESKGMMEKAMQLNPNYRPYALQTLGVALANSGQFDMAATYFEKALEADDGLGLAAFNLGVSLMSLGRIEEAERAFTRAANLCKEDMGTLAAVARAYIKMGMYERGISLARDVLRENPANAEALYAVGLGLEAQGKDAEALDYYEKALRYAPGSLEIIGKIRVLRSGRSAR